MLRLSKTLIGISAGLMIFHISFSQNDTLSIFIQKQELGQALFQIEHKTPYRFFYSNDRVNLKKEISIQCQGESISMVLYKMLKGTHVDFKISGYQVLLVPSRKIPLIENYLQRKLSSENPSEFMANSVAGRYDSTFAISGTVYDNKTGIPLPGVNVIISGTKRGTATHSDGNFDLQVKAEDRQLQFSCVGYHTKNADIRNKIRYKIGMDLDTKPLEEVIVIGYGEVRQGDLTGSIASIRGEQINQLPVAGIDDALHGKASGVFVTSSSGQPGAPVSVKIRGMGTVNNSEPLFVLDGIPFVNEIGPSIESNPLNAINPADIQSLEVLKDASATAIYGSRGANGIVMVNTMRGHRGGKTSASFSAYGGVLMLGKSLHLLDNRGYLGFLDSMYLKGDNTPQGFPIAYTNPLNTSVNNDWQQIVTQKAQVQNYHFSVSGGGIKSNYYISSGYLNQEGIMRGSGFDRLTITLNSDYNINKFQIGESLHISRLSQLKEATGMGSALETSPIMPVYDSRNKGGFAGPAPQTTGNNNGTNVLAENTLQEVLNRTTRIFGGIFASYEVTPWLKFRSSLSGDYSINYGHRYFPVYDLGTNGEQSIRGNSISKLYQSSAMKPVWLIENLFTINQNIGDHSFGLIIGHSAQAYYSRELSAGASNVNSPDESIIHSDRPDVEVEENIQEWRLLSYLGRFTYSYKDKYLLTSSIRTDGSSRFTPSHRFGWFPSFSAGWKISQEDFYQLPFMNYLKLRVGWGISGNQEIGNYGYESEITNTYSLYAFGPNQKLYFGGTPLQQYGNRNIHWESNNQTDIGLDIGLLDNKIMIISDYYYRLTRGMLVKVPLSGLSGYLQGFAEPYLNVGTILNRGIEISISWHQSWRKGSLAITANAATIHNQVLNLGGNIIIGGFNGETITMEGYSLGSFYGYVSEGIFQDMKEIGAHAIQSDDSASTQPGDIKFKDIIKDGKITPEDRTIIGKSIPDLIYGGTLNLHMGNFDCTLSIQGVQGVDIYNETRRKLESPSNIIYNIDHNKLVSVLNYWRPENTGTNISRLTRNDLNGNDRISNRWIDDGSYLRIKNFEIGYNLPAGLSKKINASNFRIYVASQNLFTLTSYPGLDPEFGPISPTGYGGEALQQNNIDTSIYPQFRTFLGGLQVYF